MTLRAISHVVEGSGIQMSDAMILQMMPKPKPSQKLIIRQEEKERREELERLKERKEKK